MKKKFTMLLASLFLYMGAWAQTLSDGIYTITNEYNRRGTLVAVENQANVGAANVMLSGYEGKSETAMTNGEYWYVRTSESHTFLYNIGNGQFLNLHTDDVAQFTEDAVLGLSLTKKEEYYVVKNNDFYLSCCPGYNKGQTIRWLSFSEADSQNLTFASVSDMDFTNQIEAADAKIKALLDKTINVTYKYVCGDDVWGTEVVEVVKGEACTEIVVPFGVTLSYPVETVPDTWVENEEVTITCTLDGTLPFTFAADFNSIETWYYMNIHSAGYYLNYVEGATSVTLNTTSVSTDSKDAYTWGFVGNPISGYQIVNLSAGANKVLSSSTTISGDGEDTYPIMTEIPVPEGNNTLWIPTATTNRTNGFYLEQKGYENHKMNRRGINLAYWTGGADTGSTFVVQERPMGPAAELTALIEEIEAAGIVSGNNPGEYTAASVNTLNAALDDAKALQSATEDDVTTLQTAYDALETNPINEGKYFIVNAKPAFNDSKVLTTYGVCGWYGTASTPAWTEKSTNDPLQYWEIEVSGETYSLKSAYEGSYITSVSTLGDAPTAATFTWLAPGQYNITVAGGRLHANLHGWGVSSSNIINYPSGANDASAWKLVAVSEEPIFTHELTVGDAGWATLMLGYDAVIPADVKAYLVKGLVEGTNEYVQLEQIESVLPANTPVIIEATANKYTFTSTTSSASVEGNLLEGTLYPKNIAEEAYVLSIVNGNVGLYKAELNQENNTAFLNNANKVYLPASALTTTAQALRLTRDGETSIDKAQLTIDNVVIYDLTGRRVEKMEKGIYIVNGKKIIK